MYVNIFLYFAQTRDMKKYFLVGLSFLLVGAMVGGALLISFYVPTRDIAVGGVAVASNKPIAWGLGNYATGKKPNPPPGSVELLEKYDGVWVVDGKDGQEAEKKVYLTFDLGYEAGWTGEVLDILKKHNIKAVFFLCGHYLKSTDLVTRMISEGHMIGNHTNKHKDLPTLSDEGIREDIAVFNTMFNEQYGEMYGNKPLTLFRPGKGRMCERTVRIASEEGLRTMMWSNAIVDWGKAEINVQKSSDTIMKRMHPGMVMLLHISNAGMPKMLDALIPRVLAEGYEFGDVWGI